MIECNLGKLLKTDPPRCPKNTFPEVFGILIPNGLNGVNNNSVISIKSLL